jgi:dTDP-4-dehydrorhamnose reductase
MLGHSVLSEFQKNFEGVLFTSRRGEGVSFDAQKDEISSIERFVAAGDYIINCLGVTKTHINEDLVSDRMKAIFVNSYFPNKLAEMAERVGVRVLQIATDCVYSGEKGSYLETDKMDATDVYGKTKSLGESVSGQTMHLRVSTIGRELQRSTMLLEWILNQPIGSTIPGYTDHIWNGISTFHFAKIARGIVEHENFQSGVSHIVPDDTVTKAELLRLIATAFGRDDIRVIDTQSSKRVDRTLNTINSDFNTSLWKGAGYDSPPSISRMVGEIAQ